MSFNPSPRPPSTGPVFSVFPANLKYLRKCRGMNQEEVSVLFNKKANTIGNWENGKSEPSIPELLVISGYFGVNLEDLLRVRLQTRDADNKCQLRLWPDSAPLLKLTPVPAFPIASGTVSISLPDPVTASPDTDPPAVLPSGTGNGNEVPADRQTDNVLVSKAEASAMPGDALWFLLRELRQVQERLDQLQVSVAGAGKARPADKSEH